MKSVTQTFVTVNNNDSNTFEVITLASPVITLGAVAFLFAVSH